MRKILIAIACIASTSAVAIEAGQHAAPPSRPAGQAMQLAQACGWYAIFICSRGRGEAQRWANRHTGYVIHTSSARYPNFAAGWFCVVEGPMGHGAAVSSAARWRRSGASPTAYAKNAC